MASTNDEAPLQLGLRRFCRFLLENEQLVPALALKLAELRLELVCRFHGGHGLLLLLVEQGAGLLLLCSQLVHLLLHMFLHLLELGLVEVLDFLQVSLVLLVTILQSGRVAWLLGLRLYELDHGIVVAGILVLLAIRRESWAEVLQGGVALNTVLLADLLCVVHSAVDIDDQGIAFVVELLTKLVPIRLQLLAVASPRRLELGEHKLALLHPLDYLLVPVALVGLQGLGIGTAPEGGRREHGQPASEHREGSARRAPGG
mmetsp:Transcript_120087/g.383346  ORF Transcript_120087/g.383346 Transcript_120087/m.383346 type:complete len:259 (+) Transcript_120087:157-933(+)